MPSAAYVTVDVFTRDRFSGNQLAVIPDARGLSGEEMQQIAAEFRYSEVTFVLPPENPENTAQVRIFTPTMEVPFAGHPNVGTAFVLGNQPDIFGRAPAGTLRFEERAGLVEAVLKRDHSGRVDSAAILAPEAFSTGAEISADTIAACASLQPEDILHRTHPPVIASVGLPFAIAEATNLETLARACPNTAAFAAADRVFSGDGEQFALFLYCRLTGDPRQVRARMFAPLDNVIEDPATGSASGALAALLAHCNPTPSLETHLSVEQGVEMGRRSRIELQVEKLEGSVRSVRISGNCVAVMRGVIEF